MKAEKLWGIPWGLYCHNISANQACPFFKSVKGRDYCELLCDFLSIDDAVKDCGLNDETDFLDSVGVDEEEFYGLVDRNKKQL